MQWKVLHAVLCLLLFTGLFANAQLRPESSAQPEIDIHTSPNAEVYLDDTFQGRASADGRLVIQNPKPGRHALRISLAGKKSYQGSVNAVAGQAVRVNLLLQDLKAAEPTKPAELAKPAAAVETSMIIETVPGAMIFINHNLKGRTDPQGRFTFLKVAPGQYYLLVDPLAGRKPVQQNITVEAGRENHFKVDIPENRPPVVTSPAERAEAVRQRLVSLGVTAVQARANPKDGLMYNWITPGKFLMGCSPGDGECFNQENPAHEVTITKGFWIGQTLVTVGAYKRFALEAGRPMPDAPGFDERWAKPNLPIVSVTWDDAQSYCASMGGRLPTEAEWEYAARGGSTDARYGNLADIAWYSQNSQGQPHEVAQKGPNGFGLYDTLGNVWEWMNDWYADYQPGPARDPVGPSSGQSRVLRPI